MKVVMYISQTINGFIAKENDETPWSEEVWKSYYAFAKKFKAIILGKKTYEIMKDAKEFEKIGNPLVIVLSNKKQSSDDAIFVNSPKDAISFLNKKGFTEVILGGGARANTSFLKENLIDEIYLDIESKIFGSGISLFTKSTFEINLQLVSAKKISDNLVQLHYKIKK